MCCFRAAPHGDGVKTWLAYVDFQSVYCISYYINGQFLVTVPLHSSSSSASEEEKDEEDAQENEDDNEDHEDDGDDDYLRDLGAPIPKPK